jgi:predicted nucleic acid-binding protein
VPIYYLWRPNLKDEGDNFLIELAVAGNAEIIVTNNVNDLGSAELSFEALKIYKYINLKNYFEENENEHFDYKIT